MDRCAARCGREVWLRGVGVANILFRCGQFGALLAVYSWEEASGGAKRWVLRGASGVAAGCVAQVERRTACSASLRNLRCG